MTRSVLFLLLLSSFWTPAIAQIEQATVQIDGMT